MKNRKTDPALDSLGLLILEVFRLNGRLLASGDALVSEFGLTSARWQVLGAIAMASQAEPVSRLARSVGAHRQGVQRIVNELARDGLVSYRENPHHRRAQLVVLTESGAGVYAAAMKKRGPWIKSLAKDLHVDEILAATQVLERLRDRLDRQ